MIVQKRHSCILPLGKNPLHCLNPERRAIAMHARKEDNQVRRTKVGIDDMDIAKNPFPRHQ